MWLVCKILHVLPSDPYFQSLDILQIIWIIENYYEDLRLEAKAYKKGGDSYTEVGEEVETSDEDMAELLKLANLSQEEIKKWSNQEQLGVK